MFDPRKAGEEADAMITGLNQPTEVENQEAVNTEAIAQDSANAESEQETGAEDTTVVNTVVESESDNVVTPDVSGLSAKLDTLTKQLDAANQRWKVLQGMVDKKDDELQNLRVMLAQLASREDTPQPDNQSVAPATLITAEDVKEYGTDLLDLIGRKAREIFAAEFDNRMPQMQERFGKLESSLQTVEQTTTKTAKTSFEGKLAEDVPDWRELNVDPGFLTWLEGTDPYTGLRKLDLLRNAYAEMDATRTAAFFVTYKKEANIVSSASAAETPVSPPKEDDKLVKLVAPGKSKTNTPRQETNNRVWSRTEIAKLYDDKMAGRISQTEFDKLERDLFRAQQEGRIAA